MTPTLTIDQAHPALELYSSPPHEADSLFETLLDEIDEGSEVETALERLHELLERQHAQTTRRLHALLEARLREGHPPKRKGKAV